MAQTKVFSPSGWSSFDRPVVMAIPYGSRGVSGDDAADFMKTASASPEFMRQLENVKLAKDEIPVHTLALGATEFFGPNRNGDGFKQADCRARHDTFRKHAKWYRNHKNRGDQGDPYYGYVKASCYNEKMKRVELLAVLNGSEKVARINGGFLADRELEKLARGDDIPVSMACKVAYDVCSSCGNKARTRAEYCTADTCPGGGCRNNLTKVSRDGNQLYVDNPDPHFFDISNVYRGADRTAFASAADYLTKAAGDGIFTPGAELAEILGVVAPFDLGLDASLTPDQAAMLKLANVLATMERDSTVAVKYAHALTTPPMTDAQLARLGTPGTKRANATLAAMADHKVVMSFDDFARWHGKPVNSAERVAAMFNDLADQFEAMLKKQSYDLVDALTGPADDLFAQSLAPTHGFDTYDVARRVASGDLAGVAVPNPKSGIEKSAAAGRPADPIVEQYALYKLAALCRAAGDNDGFRLTALLAVAQNKFC